MAGARRIRVGAGRDHLLGVRAVNGRGEIFKSGGRVMKNVTGYDLCRGLAGSWGTLAGMPEATALVAPALQASPAPALHVTPGDDGPALERRVVPASERWLIDALARRPTSRD